jgi:predicted nucleotide-binding protein
VRSLGKVSADGQTPARSVKAVKRIAEALFEQQDLIYREVSAEGARWAAGSSTHHAPVHGPGEAGTPMNSPRKTDVFLVHGRNGRARAAVERMLNHLSLTTVQWEQAIAATGSASPYVLQTIEAGFKLAQAAVVLFTPDETASLREELRKKDDRHAMLGGVQPRPNVLIEAGIALGMQRDRTVIVEVCTVREISDLAGINTVRLNASPASRLAFQNRLQSAGCDVRVRPEYFEDKLEELTDC